MNTLKDFVLPVANIFQSEFGLIREFRLINAEALEVEYTGEETKLITVTVVLTISATGGFLRTNCLLAFVLNDDPSNTDVGYSFQTRGTSGDVLSYTIAEKMFLQPGDTVRVEWLQTENTGEVVKITVEDMIISCES